MKMEIGLKTSVGSDFVAYQSVNVLTIRMGQYILILLRVTVVILVYALFGEAVYVLRVRGVGGKLPLILCSQIVLSRCFIDLLQSTGKLFTLIQMSPLRTGQAGALQLFGCTLRTYYSLVELVGRRIGSFLAHVFITTL